MEASLADSVFPRPVLPCFKRANQTHNSLPTVNGDSDNPLDGLDPRSSKDGPDFLVLITPCKRDNSPSCECTAEFRNTRSKEFADYVASFPHGKVPVVYEVGRDASGQVWGTRLSSVGNWSREKLAYPPDGPLGVSHEFKFSKAGERKSARYMIRETALG